MTDSESRKQWSKAAIQAKASPRCLATGPKPAPITRKHLHACKTVENAAPYVPAVLDCAHPVNVGKQHRPIFTEQVMRNGLSGLNICRSELWKSEGKQLDSFRGAAEFRTVLTSQSYAYIHNCAQTQPDDKRTKAKPRWGCHTQTSSCADGHSTGSARVPATSTQPARLLTPSL